MEWINKAFTNKGHKSNLAACKVLLLKNTTCTCTNKIKTCFPHLFLFWGSRRHWLLHCRWQHSHKGTVLANPRPTAIGHTSHRHWWLHWRWIPETEHDPVVEKGWEGHLEIVRFLTSNVKFREAEASKWASCISCHFTNPIKIIYILRICLPQFCSPKVICNLCSELPKDESHFPSSALFASADDGIEGDSIGLKLQGLQPQQSHLELWHVNFDVDADHDESHENGNKWCSTFTKTEKTQPSREEAAPGRVKVLFAWSWATWTIIRPAADRFLACWDFIWFLV